MRWWRSVPKTVTVTGTASTDSVTASLDTLAGTAHRVSNNNNNNNNNNKSLFQARLQWCIYSGTLIYDHSQNHIGVVVKVWLFYSINSSQYTCIYILQYINILSALKMPCLPSYHLRLISTLTFAIFWICVLPTPQFDDCPLSILSTLRYMRCSTVQYVLSSLFLGFNVCWMHDSFVN